MSYLVRQVIRASIFLGALIFSPCLLAQNWVDQFHECGQGVAALACEDFTRANFAEGHAWRLAGPFPSFCGGQSIRYVCQTNSFPCLSQPGTQWNQSTQSCECPLGQFFNSETQQCDLAQCPDPGDKAGFLSVPTSRPTVTLCHNNCQVVLFQVFKNGDSFIAEYEYTGNNCIPSGGDQPDPDNPVPEHPEPEEDPEDPDNAPSTDPTNDGNDSDGDGLPDGSDPDVDGDGIPNSEDPDIDGDGVPNTEDLDPGGEDKESSAYTDDDCIVRPTCDGDAIQCAQLMEFYRLRCLNDNDFTEEDANSKLSDFQETLDQTLDDVDSSYEEAFNIKDEFLFDVSLRDKIENLFPDSSCSDLSWETPSSTVYITCSDTQRVRDLTGLILGVFACIYIYNLARTPVQT